MTLGKKSCCEYYSWQDAIKEKHNQCKTQYLFAVTNSGVDQLRLNKCSAFEALLEGHFQKERSHYIGRAYR